MIRDDDDNAGPPHSKLVEDALVSVRIGGLHAIVSSDSKLKRGPSSLTRSRMRSKFHSLQLLLECLDMLGYVPRINHNKARS